MRSETKRSIRKVFAGRGASLELFQVVMDVICSLGSVQVVPRKTLVAFGRPKKFAWVWLPQMWIRQAPSDSITLTFGLDHRLRHPGIKQVVEPYPGRFTHHVVITQASEVDITVERWLREAYELAGKKHAKRPVGKRKQHLQ